MNIRKLMRLSLFAAAIFLAYSFKGKDKFQQTYGVLSEDATYFYVGRQLDDLNGGIDYICVEESGSTCSISTEAATDAQNRILKSSATRHGLDLRIIYLIDP